MYKYSHKLRLFNYFVLFRNFSIIQTIFLDNLAIHMLLPISGTVSPILNKIPYKFLFFLSVIFICYFQKMDEFKIIINLYEIDHQGVYPIGSILLDENNYDFDYFKSKGTLNICICNLILNK